jgi:hypothetical protein
VVELHLKGKTVPTLWRDFYPKGELKFPFFTDLLIIKSSSADTVSEYDCVNKSTFCCVPYSAEYGVFGEEDNVTSSAVTDFYRGEPFESLFVGGFEMTVE